MLEAEVKLEIDATLEASLRARLAEKEATQGSPIQQLDIYFAHPNRDFAQTDEALRIRCDDHGLFITYKGKKLDPPRKTREEIEFGLATETDTAVQLLERIGFSQVARVEKTRTEFSLAGPPRAIVSIDQVGELGTFCEVEVSAATVEEGRDSLDLCLRELGLAERAPIPTSYLELLLAERS